MNAAGAQLWKFATRHCCVSYTLTAPSTT